MMSLFLLIIGFVCLIKGADFFVDGASAIARKFNIPTVIIGLTLVAMGTSLPEASVNIAAGLHGINEMCMANVVGSNFFNILVILGFSGIMTNSLPVDKENYINIKLLIAICILLFACAIDLSITRIEAGIMVIAFIFYIVSNVLKAKNMDNDSVEEKETTKKFIIKLILGIIGIGLIVKGGDLVVLSASDIARSLGLSDNFIGLTIVAVGTSLPELVTSLIAIRKGEKELAVGNVVGSNIFNILFILGISSFINPLTFSMAALYDVIFMTLITILLFIFVKDKEKIINRKEGIIFVMLYIGYIVFTFLR